MTDTPDVTSYSDPEYIASAHESGMTFESAMEAVKVMDTLLSVKNRGAGVHRQDFI